MKYHRLPQLDQAVSTISLGTMLFGNPVVERDAIKLTHEAIDRGVNFLDTADIYEGYDRSAGSSGGVSETTLGKAVRGRREKVVVASKVGNATGPGPDDQGLGKTHVGRGIEATLKRLGTDYLDIFYMHKPDPETPLAESVQTFVRLIETGKTRAWGISNFSTEIVRAIIRLCRENGWPLPAVSQPPYSLLRRDIEADHLPVCHEAGIAIVAYRVLEGGILTGKYTKNAPAPADSRKAEMPSWLLKLTDDLYPQLDTVRTAAREANLSMTQYAIAKVLSRPGIVSAIIGVKRLSQLEEAIASAEATLSPTPD